MSLVTKVVTMLALLGLGVVARQAGLLTAERRDRLNTVAFYVALPALVFGATATQSLESVLAPRLVVGYWVVLFTTVAFALVVHRKTADPAERSVATIQSYHGNLGFLGLPIVATAFGATATAKAGLLLGVGSLTQIPVTLSLLTKMTGTNASVRDELYEFLTTPVVVALSGGMVVAGLGVPVPDVVVTATSTVGEAALPLALLVVGGSLVLDREAVDGRTVGTVVALKVFTMPVLALAVFSALHASPSTLRAGVLMLAMPCAVSTYVYATELGGDTRLAAANTFMTTVVSLGTVFVLLGTVL